MDDFTFVQELEVLLSISFFGHFHHFIIVLFGDVEKLHIWRRNNCGRPWQIIHQWLVTEDVMVRKRWYPVLVYIHISSSFMDHKHFLAKSSLSTEHGTRFNSLSSDNLSNLSQIVSVEVGKMAMQVMANVKTFVSILESFCGTDFKYICCL